MRATYPNHHLWNNRDRHVTSDIVLQLRPWYSDTHDLHEKDVKNGTAKCEIHAIVTLMSQRPLCIHAPLSIRTDVCMHIVLHT